MDSLNTTSAQLLQSTDETPRSRGSLVVDNGQVPTNTFVPMYVHAPQGHKPELEKFLFGWGLFNILFHLATIGLGLYLIFHQKYDLKTSLLGIGIGGAQIILSLCSFAVELRKPTSQREKKIRLTLWILIPILEYGFVGLCWYVFVSIFLQCTTCFAHYLPQGFVPFLFVTVVMFVSLFACRRSYCLLLNKNSN
jgi:hypothetical protein